MSKKLFSTDRGVTPDDAPVTPSRDQKGLGKTISNWRFRRDVAAIVAALDRLPSRRLHLIGLNKDGLFDSVCDMILSAEEERAIGREVSAMLDATKGKKEA